MNSREKVRAIFERRHTGSAATWLGNPYPATTELYAKALGLRTQQDLHDYFDDDCRWISPEWGAYKHPDNKPMWDVLNGAPRRSLGQPGFFADSTDPADVERFAWPDPDYLDFSECLARIRAASDKAVLSGMWCSFFHVACDLFGMENYFVKMYTDPAVVEAVTDRIVGFYLEANERFLIQAGETFDTLFIGNDFGSQQDLLISVELFKQFVLPGFEKFIDQAKRYNKKLLLHSCGAIDKAIPLLLDAGVDALHPLQARAAGMDAASLAKKYKGRVAFVGGVDTQELLVNASPNQVKEEVRRLVDRLGPHLVVSPSHEALLPNVPLVNVEAMFEAVRELRDAC